MGRAAKDANDVMKLLTLVSAVFLPGVVLAGVMGMNFQLAFFDNAGNFWVVIAAMVVFAVADPRRRPLATLAVERVERTTRRALSTRTRTRRRPRTAAMPRSGRPWPG